MTFDIDKAKRDNDKCIVFKTYENFFEYEIKYGKKYDGKILTYNMVNVNKEKCIAVLVSLDDGTQEILTLNMEDIGSLRSRYRLENCKDKATFELLFYKDDEGKKKLIFCSDDSQTFAVNRQSFDRLKNEKEVIVLKTFSIEECDDE